MSIRKRTWTNAKGEEKASWVVDYFDSAGVRRLKSFRLKKDADSFAATAKVEVREGTHVADSASATVEEAGKLWLKASERRVERGTLVQYRQHVSLHINPMIGQTLLSRLTVPAVREFEEELVDQGRSAAMVRKVMVTLGSILSDAQERGLTVRNAVREKGQGATEGQRPQAGEAPEGQAEARRGYSDAGRDQGAGGCHGGSLAPFAAHGDLHRLARLGAARLAMGRRGS